MLNPTIIYVGIYVYIYIPIDTGVPIIWDYIPIIWKNILSI